KAEANIDRYLELIDDDEDHRQRSRQAPLADTAKQANYPRFVGSKIGIGVAQYLTDHRDDGHHVDQVAKDSERDRQADWRRHVREAGRPPADPSEDVCEAA